MVGRLLYIVTSTNRSFTQMSETEPRPLAGTFTKSHHSRFLILGGICLLAFILLAVFVFVSHQQDPDDHFLAWLSRHRTVALTSYMNWLSFLGSTGFLFPAYLVVVTYCLSERAFAKAAYFAASGAGVFLLTNLLKNVFERPRPPGSLIHLPETFSFPSGHSSSGLTFYLLLAWLIGQTLHSAWKGVLVVFFTFFAISIGVSRLYLGVHYPTDVLAGFSLAGCWMSLLYWTFNHFYRKKPGHALFT